MSEQRIAEVFVELADTLVADFDVVDFLHVLSDRCVELLDVDASGLMLSDERGRLQLVAGTSRATRDLELFELEVDEGPCVETFATGKAILNVEVAAAGERWPRFCRAAAEAGVRHTSALPMRLRGRVIGALNLFSPTPISATGLALGQAMADVATIGLINERSLREKTVLSEQLQGALQSRIVIEQAKGVLAARAGTGVAEAFTRMRDHARRSGTSLTAVATAVVTGALRLDLPPAP
ncbi:GAF and ANTAR domain-containing protein [Kineococcus radiotolerans]|uniref:Response regulator receiver and ANTAR domain protein n=1 Tax=Kineococcus radiotolerans (strain ATCC BAA-149 / DSM 14245 / SRS30216) TaxID=266940 RepID=A6W4H5_KINRD|nr:GAF and ANTAR domain-containing protein [Kineococcus radiotolerans]ABS01714.1 response regulator receiver and ANTAR domain protein [Kineococcus radiotolerans SRS30216 = ATCC BAA-149]